MDIDLNILKIEGFGDLNPATAAGYLSHKFVVGYLDNHHSFIYVAPGNNNHEAIVEKFGVGMPIGGGSCYVNNEDLLILGGSSGTYQAIPKEAAKEFAEVIRVELEKKGVIIRGIVSNPDEWTNDFWKEELGFPSTTQKEEK